MRDFIKNIELQAITAADEMSFLNNVGRLMGQTLPTIGELEGAFSVACNCVRVFYATRGQVDAVLLPEDILRRLSLGEIASLAGQIPNPQQDSGDDWECGSVE